MSRKLSDYLYNILTPTEKEWEKIRKAQEKHTTVEPNEEASAYFFKLNEHSQAVKHEHEKQVAMEEAFKMGQEEVQAVLPRVAQLSQEKMERGFRHFQKITPTKTGGKKK